MFFEKPSFGPSTFSAGEPAEFGDIYNAAYDSGIHVDNINARQVAREEAYDRRITSIEQATGIKLNNPMRAFNRGGRTPSSSFEDPEQAFEKRLGELGTQFPDQRDAIRADYSPRREAAETAAAAEGRTSDLMARTPGAAKYFAQFGGTFRASLEDPFQVATLAAGPWRNVGTGAKAVLWSGVKQGAANAAVVGAMQPVVQDWRREAGLDYGLSQAAANTAVGFGFGVVADVGIRGAYRGAQKLAGRAPKLDARGGVAGYENAADALERAAKDLPEDHPVRQAADGDPKALQQLVRDAGIDADPAIAGALRALDLEGDLDGRAPGVDAFDGDSKLMQALRAAEDGDEPAPRGADLVADQRTPRLDDDAPLPVTGAARTFEVEGKPVTFGDVDPRRTVTDAASFQFKGGGDISGQTGRLNGVEKWDDLASGRVMIFEARDGRQIVADGHQRDGLAKRLIDQNPKLSGFVFREADGWTVSDVRALAAKKNLQEGSGTTLDAATIMRERPDIIDRSVPLGSEAMRQARALARLSDDAFAEVKGGGAPANYAALVADLVEDRARHASVLREVMSNDPANAREARFMIGDILQAATVHEVQLTLLGAEHISRSLLPERAKVLDAAMKSLRDDKRIFTLLTREARRIEGAGNRLSDANSEKALEAAAVEAAIEQLASTRGKVSDWLTEAARANTQGLTTKQAADAFARRVKDTLERDGIKGLAAEPQTLRQGGIDEPGGAEARLQVESLEREFAEDIERALKPEKHEARQAALFKLTEGLPLFSLRSSPVTFTPQAAQLSGAIRAEFMKTLEMLPKNIKLRVLDRITFKDDPGLNAEGLFDPVSAAVYVSLRAADPVRVSRHEVVHALRQGGYLSEGEFDTLYAGAERLNLRAAYGIDRKYKEAYTKAYGHRGDTFVESLLREETVAEMFADYSLNGRRFGTEGHAILDKIIDTIVQFMERMRNALDGLGFRDVRDVFEKIESGDVARRAGGGLPDDLKVSQRAGEMKDLAEACKL